MVGVFQKTPGAVKLTFSVAPGRRQFTSHSVWRDSDAAQEFFKSPEHREAMKRAYAGMTDEFYVIHTGRQTFLQPALSALSRVDKGHRAQFALLKMPGGSAASLAPSCARG